MPYIITNGTEYIYKNNAGKYVSIRNRAFADEFDKKVAENILNNSLSKRVKIGMYIKKVDDGKKSDLPAIPTECKKDEFKLPDNIQEWLDKINTLNGLAEEATKRLIQLTEEQSEVEKKIVDLSHYAEFSSMNACIGYKVSKKWHDLLSERRTIKNEITVVKFILNKKLSESINEEVAKLINSINNQEYHPRALKEIFDI